MLASLLTQINGIAPPFSRLHITLPPFFSLSLSLPLIPTPLKSACPPPPDYPPPDSPSPLPPQIHELHMPHMHMPHMPHLPMPTIKRERSRGPDLSPPLDRTKSQKPFCATSEKSEHALELRSLDDSPGGSRPSRLAGEGGDRRDGSERSPTPTRNKYTSLHACLRRPPFLLPPLPPSPPSSLPPSSIPPLPSFPRRFPHSLPHPFHPPTPLPFPPPPLPSAPSPCPFVFLHHALLQSGWRARSR